MEKKEIKLSKLQQIQFDNLKLTIELIPKPCWQNNVRKILTKSQWENIKRIVFKKADYKCEICGGIGIKHPVECHEIWHFDDKNKVQTLIKFISICPLCHQVKHIGLTKKLKIQNGERAIKRFQEINSLSDEDTILFHEYFWQIWRQRNQYKWKLDIKYLKEYGIEIAEKEEEVCPYCKSKDFIRTSISKKGKYTYCKCIDCGTSYMLGTLNYRYIRKTHTCISCKSKNVIPGRSFSCTFPINKCNQCGKTFESTFIMTPFEFKSFEYYTSALDKMFKEIDFNKLDKAQQFELLE